MKKQKDVSQLTVLRKVMEVTLETAVEIIEKKGVLSFVNNGFTVMSIGGQLPELAAEVRFVRENPKALQEIENEAAAKYPQYEKNLILQTINKIHSAIIFNVSTAISIADDWTAQKNTPN